MALLEKATAWLLTLVTENEEVKKFPNDFVTESMKWVRSWFLKDDPMAAAIVQMNGNEGAKQLVFEQKLPKLLENETFKKELEAQLAAFAAQKALLKNVLSDSQIEAAGNVHIGDRGASSGNAFDQKNVVKGSSIKTGDDFHLGDDIVQAKPD